MGNTHKPTMELPALDVEVEIRERRVEDAAEVTARAQLLRASVLEHISSAFMLFLLHEVTLQICVLMGAVLFIFCGVSALKCLVVVPLTLLLVWASVTIAHQVDAMNKEQRQRREVCGWVAVAREPLNMSPARSLRLTISDANEKHVANGNSVESKSCTPTRNKVVGTVSLEESREPLRSGWLISLAVDPQYRRQGVARQLVRGVCKDASMRGLVVIEAATSELQSGARSLLHTAGWQTRAVYHRQVGGGMYSLALTHFSRDLLGA